MTRLVEKTQIPTVYLLRAIVAWLFALGCFLLIGLMVYALANGDDGEGFGMLLMIPVAWLSLVGGIILVIVGRLIISQSAIDSAKYRTYGTSFWFIAVVLVVLLVALFSPVGKEIAALYLWPAGPIAFLLAAMVFAFLGFLCNRRARRC